MPAPGARARPRPDGPRFLARRRLSATIPPRAVPAFGAAAHWARCRGVRPRISGAGAERAGGRRPPPGRRRGLRGAAGRGAGGLRRAPVPRPAPEPGPWPERRCEWGQLTLAMSLLQTKDDAAATAECSVAPEHVGTASRQRRLEAAGRPAAPGGIAAPGRGVGLPFSEGDAAPPRRRAFGADHPSAGRRLAPDLEQAIRRSPPGAGPARNAGSPTPI